MPAAGCCPRSTTSSVCTPVAAWPLPAPATPPPTRPSACPTPLCTGSSPTVSSSSSRLGGRPGPGRPPYVRGARGRGNFGDDRAAVAGGRPALRAGLVTVDRCRGGVLRPDLAGAQTAPAQALARCLRGNAAQQGPSRQRPGVGGRPRALLQLL